MWHKLSDSESESDPEYEYGYRSDSSVSENSDEDFLCSFSHKKQAKPTGRVGRVGPKQGRGVKRKLEELPLLVTPQEGFPEYLVKEEGEEEDEEDEEEYEEEEEDDEEDDEEYVPLSRHPPPLLVRPEQQNLPTVISNVVKPKGRAVPALIKAAKSSSSPMGKTTRVEQVNVSASHSLVKNQTVKERPKIQPPPELLKQEPHLRKPPPLVKNKEGTSQQIPQQVVVLPQVKTGSRSPHHLTLASPVPLQSHVSLRQGAEGFVRGDLSVSKAPEGVPMEMSSSPYKKVAAVPLHKQAMQIVDGSKSHYKHPISSSSPQPSSSSSPSPHSSTPHSSPSRPIKLTQYKLQSGSVVAQQPSTPHTPHYFHPSTTSPTPPQQQQQYQHGVPLQNLMAPIQIIQGVPTAAVQMPSYTAPPGSMILVQGPQGMTLAQDVSSTFVTQGGGQPCQLLPATPMEILPSEGSQKVSVIMDMGGTTAYVSQGEVQGYITQLDGPPSTTKKSRKYKNSKQLGKKFQTARQEEQARLGVVMEEEREEGEGMEVDEGVSPDTQEQLLLESDHKEQLSSGNPATAVLQNKTEHTTTAFQTAETESPMLIGRSAPALVPVPDLLALEIDATAWVKETGMRGGDSSVISGVPDNLTLLPVGMHSGSRTGGGIGGLRKSVSAEDLMTEQLKSYLEKEKRARKAKCLSPPQEDGTVQALLTTTTPTTQEVSAHIVQRKKTLQRQRSTSSTTSTSSRSASTSPTRGKSPKSSRLVVSPTLFSTSVVGGHQFVGALRYVTSTATVCKNRSLKMPTVSSPVSVSDRDSRLQHPQNSHTDPSISLEPSNSLHHGNSRTPSKGKEKAGSNPKGELRQTRQTIKAGKSKEHRISSPDLSDLFLPDNLSPSIPASVSNKSWELKKIPETCVAHSGVRKLVEFSSSLTHTHTSSLKRPIPMKTEASGTALDKSDDTLGTSVRQDGHHEQEGRQQEERLPVTDFSIILSNQVILKIGDRRQFEGGSFSENTNNCNSNESSDSSNSNPKSSQKQASEGKGAESEGEGSCHEEQEEQEQEQHHQQQQQQQQQEQQQQEQQQQQQQQEQQQQGRLPNEKNTTLKQ